MIWFLGFLGLVLALLGLWGGPAPRGQRPDPESTPRRQPTVAEAWNVLGTPLQDELIKIPEHRPWYAPGGDKRFQRGLMLGLGTGLLVSALTVTFMPRPESPGQVALDQSGAGKTTAPAQNPAQTPTVTTPQTTAPTQPQTPAPVTVTFVVEPGSSADTIAANLKAQGLIADADAFLNALSASGLDTGLKAGTFVIPTGATLDKVIEVLTS
jgi:hypothetical protein